ncbi:MAG: NAD(P)-binding protein, partial [Hyphomonadaceae bacterium]
MSATDPTRGDRSYDVVVIGSGAGGATLAQRLAESGKSILIIERGARLPVEPHNWSPREVFLRHRYKAKEAWTDRKGRPFQPNIHYWVGGNTIFYGAALYRFRKRDFEE